MSSVLCCVCECLYVCVCEYYIEDDGKPVKCRPVEQGESERCQMGARLAFLVGGRRFTRVRHPLRLGRQR